MSLDVCRTYRRSQGYSDAPYELGGHHGSNLAHHQQPSSWRFAGHADIRLPRPPAHRTAIPARRLGCSSWQLLTVKRPSWGRRAGSHPPRGVRNQALLAHATPAPDLRRVAVPGIRAPGGSRAGASSAARLHPATSASNPLDTGQVRSEQGWTSPHSRPWNEALHPLRSGQPWPICRRNCRRDLVERRANSRVQPVTSALLAPVSMRRDYKPGARWQWSGPRCLQPGPGTIDLPDKPGHRRPPWRAG